jgi:hypothetical protein
MRRAADDLRRDGASTRAILAAVDLDPRTFPDDRMLDHMPGYPFTQVRAGEYRAAAAAVGSPADSLDQLLAAPAPARAVADAQLISAVIGDLRPAGQLPRSGPAPTVDRASGAAPVTRSGCVDIAAPKAVTAGSAVVELTVHGAGVALRTDGAAALTLRRFSSEYPDEAHVRVRAGTSSLLRLPVGRASPPWHVRIVPDAQATVCGL